MTKSSKKRLGYAILIAEFLTYFGMLIPQSYGSYIFTDIMGVDATAAASALTVVNFITLIICIFNGVIIQKSPAGKMGKFRPWLFGACIVMGLGGLLMFVNVGNPSLKVIIIGLGYLLAMGMADPIYTSKKGLTIAIAGGDSEFRTEISGRQMQACYIAMVVSSATLLPMVNLVGGGNEKLGFVITQAVYAILIISGAFFYMKITKPFDGPETVSEEQNPSLLDIIKALFANRLALILIICDILRFTGYYIATFLLTYQCQYVIGDLNAMTIVMTAGCFIAFISATIAPAITAKMGGRKRSIMLFSILAGLGYASMAIFGKNLWGFVITYSLGYFFMGFTDVIDGLLYVDAGEYWLAKTGKDTRTFLAAAYGYPVKIAMTLASIGLGIALSSIHYEAGVAFTPVMSAQLTWIVGLAPGLGYLIPAFLMLFYNVSDKDMEKYIAENAQNTK